MTALKPSRLYAAAILCSPVTQSGLFLFCVISSSSSRAVNSPLHPLACTQVTGWSWQLGLEKVQQRLWKLAPWSVGYMHLTSGPSDSTAFGRGLDQMSSRGPFHLHFSKYFNKCFSTGVSKCSKFFCFTCKWYFSLHFTSAFIQNWPNLNMDEDLQADTACQSFGRCSF